MTHSVAQSKNPWKIFTAFLFLLMVLTGCDPMGIRYDIVDRTFVIDRTIYIHMSFGCSFGIGCVSYQQKDFEFYSSDTMGQTWVGVEPVPENAAQFSEEDFRLPKESCLKRDPKICYRITGASQIDMTNDGGTNWKTAWKMPDGRLEYVQRIMPMLRVAPDSEPQDLAVIEAEDEYRVIAAMGNQGVIIGTSTGIWTRHAIGSAAPLPYHASSIKEALQVILEETFYVYFAALFTAFLYKRFSSHFKISLLLLILILFFVGWIPFLLWSFGLIPEYGTAVGSSVILGIGVLVWVNLSSGQKGTKLREENSIGKSDEI